MTSGVLEALNEGLTGRYELIRELGRGGMATVYLARDLRHDREVAIKILLPELAAQLPADRFLREIQVIARMTHPQILPLLDSGRLEDTRGNGVGQPYYVMPYVPGETLRARIGRERQLSAGDAERIVREAAEAIDFAHAHGIVHRDIKPENILLLEGHAMVADFGIARALDAGAERMTATGIVIGTPTYMSPEQASGDQSLDGRSDQYALACVLYEMLTGSPPFTGPTAQAVIARHALDPAAPVRTIRPDIPPAFDAALRRAMAKAPADRFPTATAFARALSADSPNASRERGRRNSVIAAGIVGCAALLVFAYRTNNARRSATGAPAVHVAKANRNRVAVLPLRSVSPNPSDQYFAEGMTDELISTLSNIGEIKVIARSSVAAYGGAGQRATSEIARALDVGSIVDGSVRKDGQQLRISIDLSDATTGESRWSHTYDKTLTDVFAIQRDVALAVANALKIELVAGEASQVSKRPTNNLGAYDAYLRVTVLRAERPQQLIGRPSLDTAIALLRSAVQQDSNFALAWAALSQSYTDLLFAFGANVSVRDSAIVAFERALALDPTLAEGYHARSNLEYTREGGWQLGPALRDILHAVALKPGQANAHASLASLLLHTGLLEDAQRELDLTLGLDPTSQSVKFRVPRGLWQRQHFADALAVYERGRRSGWQTSIAEEALVLGYLGRAEDGLRLLQQATTRAAFQPGDDDAVAAVLLARLGRPDEARRKIQSAERLGAPTSHFHHAAFAIATAYAIMGDKPRAVSWLQRTARDGMPAYELFAHDPALASLNGNPAFDVFMRRLKDEYDGYRRILATAP